ncbi:hypothetical protein [Ferrimonas sp. YFM]|uniref:hypothetical protein n=1 Tax=Ferrimonas sp. YFM TaxID=3028878 RepID=UPI002573D7ED|nr:hypothetical protein [Ferrimonas sp. YFM]BDY05105.1 hypothetical protein F0521_21460 [Ferrimonas sp. YFM]
MNWLKRGCYWAALGLFLFPILAMVFEFPLAFQVYGDGNQLHSASNELRQFVLANYWLPACWLASGLLLIGTGIERRTITLAFGGGLLLLFPFIHYGVARLSASLLSGCDDCQVFGTPELLVNIIIVTLGALALQRRRRPAA